MSAALALTELLPGSGPFVAIDFETADHGRDSACSVALVRVENDRIVRSEARYLRPPRISEANTHVHAISAATQRAARPLVEVWPELAPMLDGVELLVAHNAPFDRSVMLASWGAAGLTPPGLTWACTAAMAKVCWPKPAVVVDHKLPTLCQLHKIPLKHHDAKSDAEACARLVLVARAEARGERPLPPLSAKPLAPPPPARPLPAAVVPREPEPDDPDVVTPIRALRWGQQARLQGGDVLSLQEQLDDPWVRALVSCGWTLEGLDRDLRQAARGFADDVVPEARVEALVRVLERPRNARPDFVEQVRRYFVANDRRRREWRNSNPDQRRALDATATDAEDEVRTSLGLLLLGGAR